MDKVNRDWSKVDWKDISEKFDAVENVNNLSDEERANTDVGITKEEYLECLLWYKENKPEVFYEIIGRLREQELKGMV